MKTCVKIAAVFAAACVMMAGPGMSQTAETQSTNPFTALKPGQWVKIKGVMQRDSSAVTMIAKEVKILTGEMQEDDWEIEAPIARIVDKAKQQVEVFGIQIDMKDDATYESDNNSLKNFDGLQTGMHVEIEGTYMKDGAFHGREMQLEAAAGADELAKLVGKVEKVDAEAKTITLMGIACHISETTKVKSAAK